MTTLREAAQQALEALQNCANGEDDVLLTRDALANLRAALAEPCPCGDRSAAECPGEWEPGCDLGNNPEYARRVELQRPAEPEPPIGKATTDVPVQVYVVKKAEPVQKPCNPACAPGYCYCEPVQEPVAAWENKYGMKEWEIHALRAGWMPAPPQRKPPATIDEMFDRMDKAPKGVFFGHDPMTIWMEAWRAAEQQHGIT